MMVQRGHFENPFSRSGPAFRPLEVRDLNNIGHCFGDIDDADGDQDQGHIQRERQRRHSAA